MNKLLAALVAGFFAVGAFAQTTTPPESAPAPVAAADHSAKKMSHKVKHSARHAKHRAHRAAKSM
ncbi:MAG: hypothetical protein NVSMB34_07890 [Variovorax sp.]